MMGLLIFSIATALSIGIVSYRSFAEARGWPVGNWLYRDGSTPKILAAVAFLWALIKSFLVLQWWAPIVVFLAGAVGGFILTVLLKKHAQWVFVLGIFPAFALVILYVSEERPLGWLHRLF